MNVRHLPIVTAALLAISLGAASCHTSPGTAESPGYKYVMGELKAELEATPQEIVEAATEALGDLEITVDQSSASGVDGKVLGRTSLDKKVSIVVTRASDTHSQLGIRVDAFGNSGISQVIYEKLKSRL